MSGEKLLQDRLQQQSGGFSGLLSLIPAKMYYGEDNTDQWNKKKQTKAEAKAARRAKLDPDSQLNRNAKEVMDERAKNKRKAREMEQEDNDDEADDNDAHDGGDMVEAIDGIDAEKPGEGLRKKTAESNKKQKRDDTKDDDDENEDNEEDWEDEQEDDDAETPIKLSKKQEKQAAKTLKRKEKRAEKKDKKAKKSDATDDKTTSAPVESAPTLAKKDKKSKKEAAPQPEPAEEEDEEEAKPSKKGALDFSGLEDDEGTSIPESDPQSPTFDTTAPNGTTASASTSVSSTVAPSEKPKHIKIPTDTSALKARLEAKIAALRAARKADGPDGKPIRTRQELIESRRAKEAQRKAHKQELRAAAKIEEQRKREEALASNSPSVMSPAVERADSPGGFAFGRVAFGDGTQLSHDLSYVLNNRGESAAAGGPPKKKKGPSDPKTALLKVQAQKKRLAELDPEKRADISEKDAWLTMRRRAEGERKIKDDEAALKKTIKRKDAAKKKSEKAWKERQDGVKMAQKEKQKKREDNLRKRKEDKMLGKAGKMKKKGGGAKKKGGRPGFEGGGLGGRKK